jgi:hypothetical protein
MIDRQTRAILATAVRNAATGQCIFTPLDNFELAYRDGQLCRVSPNSSQYERQHMPMGLRVEELPGMSDDEIWLRVMGA